MAFNMDQHGQSSQPLNERQKLHEKFVGLVRALLIPVKGGMPLEKVDRECRNLIGESIPYRKLGYPSLTDFLDQNPQMCRIQRKPDGYYVCGVATEETAHIVKFVSKQKSSKKMTRPMPARIPRFSGRTWSAWSPPSGIGQQVGNQKFSNRVRASGPQNGRRPPGGSGRFLGGSPGGSTQQKFNYGQGNQQQQQLKQRLFTPYNNPGGGNGAQLGLKANNQAYFAQQNAVVQGSQMTTVKSFSGSNGRTNGTKSVSSNGSKYQTGNPNKSPTSNPPGDFYRKLLRSYFQLNSLGEEVKYKTAVIESKTGGNSSSKGGGQKAKTFKRYISTVQVYDKKYQTFPNDYSTEETAEEAASQIACMKLNISQLSLSSRCPSSSTAAKDVRSSDTDFGTWTNGSTEKGGNSAPCNVFNDLNDHLIDRIVALVGTRTNGVWSTQIDVEYSRKFKGVKLPDNWPQKVEDSEYGQLKLKVDRPIENRCIISPNLQQQQQEVADQHRPPESLGPSGDFCKSKPEVAASKSPAMTMTKKDPFGFIPSANSLPANVVPPPAVVLPSNFNGGVSGQPCLPALVLPSDSLWNVYVTCVHSTINVCIRLLGDSFSTEFDDLVANMELHYVESEKIPPVAGPLVIGKLYAAKVEGDWHRVEVTNVRGSQITGYFIDHGDEDVMEVQQLREIAPAFLKLAPQAKNVRLAGLEEFRDDSQALSELTDMALGRSLVGNVYAHDKDGVSLVLYDTSGDDEDVNVNQCLLEKLLPKGSATSGNDSTNSNKLPALEFGDNFVPMPPMDGNGFGRDAQPIAVDYLTNVDLASLKPLTPIAAPNVDDFFDVTVTLAGSPSNFTVQSYAMDRNLHELQLELNAFYNDKAYHQPLAARHLEKDSFFAGKNKDGVWCRVKVDSMIDESTVAVKMVDYGDVFEMPLDGMQPLWSKFRKLPMQAINACLADIVAADGDWTPADVEWFDRRVRGKQFVSKIKDVSQDHSGQDPVYKLSVSLFDTSDELLDVVIDKELVDQGRAVYLCL